MTIEEKAKAYDEALEKAKAHINSKGIGDTVDLCKDLFSELVENEDERIRKFLIKLVNDGLTSFPDSLTRSDVLAYLEKQKEKFEDISTVLLVKKEIDRRIETWQKSRKEALAMECNTLADDAAVRIEELNSLISFLGTIRCSTNEKQKEQKPAKWSEKDERMMNRLIDRLNFIQYNTRTDGTSLNISFVNEIEWLKSLRPQPKQDKGPIAKFVQAVEDVEQCRKGYEEGLRDGMKRHWKPSEEQMEALRVTIDFMPDTFKPRCTLITLQNGLEKLM